MHVPQLLTPFSRVDRKLPKPTASPHTSMPREQIKVVRTTKVRAPRAAAAPGPPPPPEEQYAALVALYGQLAHPLGPELQKEIMAKIRSYAAQDVRASRPPPVDLSLKAALERLVVSRGRCAYCQRQLAFLYKEARDPLQWTFDRVDNELSHDPRNIVVTCLNCNLAKRRMSHEKFLLTKRLKLEKLG
jgi:hypothetical protein